MAVAYKSIGDFSQSSTTTLLLQQPALDVGDLVVVTVLVIEATATIPGYTQTGSAFDMGASYLLTFWKYATSASAATDISATVPTGGAFGRTVVVTGAANSAPTIVGDSINTSASYWQTSAINSTGFMVSTAMVWTGVSATGGFTTSGTITQTSSLRAHDTVSTFRYSVATHSITAASGGSIRTTLGGSSTSRARTILIAEDTGGGGSGGGSATISQYINDAEVLLSDASLRYLRDDVEYGFWYPNGSQNFGSGTTAANVSYWDGTEEHQIPLQATPTTTVLDGLSMVAYGDSFGDQLSGGGVDYNSTQLFHQVLAGKLGTTCTNRHRATFMAMDVGYRMNGGDGASLRWDPGDAEAVIFHVGGNDLKNTAAVGYTAHENAWSGIFGMLRSASRTAASGGSGTWSTLTVGSTSARQTTVPGSSITLNWTGQNATLLLWAYRSGSGASFSYSVDGGASQNKSTASQAFHNDDLGGAEGDYALVPVHIQNASSGAHSITVTHTGSNGQPLVVDSISPWHADPEDSPWVVVMPIPAAGLGDTSAFGLTISKAQILAFHERLYTVLNTVAYLPKTIVVLPDSYARWFFQSNEARHISDGYHPNLRGHQIIADVAYWGIAKGAGNGTSVPPVTDTTAPSAPTSLTASNITSSSIALSWGASTDNIGVTGYRVYRDGSLIASPTGTSYTASGLTADTQYSFYVRAADAASNLSTNSNTITPTTLEDTPVEPPEGSFGPNGTHWPSSTPAMNASFVYDVEVAATWSAIEAAIDAAPASGNARIRIQPGTLPVGNGNGSTDSPTMSGGSASRSSKILIVPRDGFGTVVGNPSSTIDSSATNGYSFSLNGVALLGLDLRYQGTVIRSCQNFAIGWGRFGTLNVTANAGDSLNNELVECVLPDQIDSEGDHSATRVANDYSVQGLLYDGCYFAPAYKANGSGAHCDTVQFSSTGSGGFDNIVFRDTILFQSSSQTIQLATVDTVNFIHSAFIGGLRATGRFPIGGDRHVMVGQNTLWGGAQDAYSSGGTVVMGSINSSISFSSASESYCSTQTVLPSGWTVNTAWDGQSTLQTAWLDANAPIPTTAYLQGVWASL